MKELENNSKVNNFRDFIGALMTSRKDTSLELLK